MTALHFIGGEKGGVGKSVMARILAQYCIDRQLPFTGFDTDRSHPTFSRFYGEFAAPTVVDDFTSLDVIAEAITDQPERRVLVDLAAQTMAPLRRWIDESGLLTLLGEQGIPVVYWQVMDDGRDCLAMLDRLLHLYGRTVTYVVVQNHGRGSDFSSYKTSPTAALATELGAKVIELRRLHEASMHKIDLHDSSFWSAVNSRGCTGSLGLLERQRVKIWLQRTFADLDGVL